MRIEGCVGGMMLIALCSCGSTSEVEQPATTSRITIEGVPSDGELVIGHYVTLSAVVRDVTGTTITNPTISWISSDPYIAAVGEGVVRGNGLGTAVITATSLGQKAQASVKIIPPNPQGTVLALVGDSADSILHGESVVFDLNNSSWATDFVVRDYRVVFRVNGKSGDSWSLYLNAPDGGQLKVGLYENARRALLPGTAPGLWLTGRGIGCNVITGRFEIKDVSFGPFDSLDRLDVLFEQHCEGRPAAIHGHLLYGYKQPKTPAV